MPRPSILTTVLPTPLQAPNDERPHVTLTYAQSLDARIAGRNGAQLILSGKASMMMTHWMRSMHDAILVGIGTALNDDPQLNTRLLPQIEGPHRTPRPVVLDTKLRLDTDCKLLRNYRAGRGRQPWLFCTTLPPQDVEVKIRRQSLENAGAVVFEAEADDAGDVCVNALLHRLRDLGIQSLMVEGGQHVISKFLKQRSCRTGRHVVDILVVTVAPILVGPQGVGMHGDEEKQPPRLRHLCSEILGNDTIVACVLEDTPV